ncbi:MAG: DUF4956 domain-containing protein [Pseudomonadales bacterium]|nr:DUF4956 domain-containing protein [Pseudomonadales bacterium]
MEYVKPLVKLTSYYLVIVAALFALLHFQPQIQTYLPFGGVVHTSADINDFLSLQAVEKLQPAGGETIRFGFSLLGVILLMQPVAWVYMGARRRKGRDQAFVLTILLLPVVVAGIVLIVQNSLALAFSLAGIVAGVRFRLSLDDTLDAIYIFVAIGVGLAAGTSALEIGLLVSLFFNYAVLIFWLIDYGADVSVNRWFSRTWMNTGAADPEKKIP